ncbi:unnamed protein product [Trifolium pratense]|uniref:Uncharacterized protein n=1 Tax=Trifolium pratense TaxID=57577 RepID=A0ACB0IAI9_TRIPR|nr:unnamed protein product [Trifolium pratense]
MLETNHSSRIFRGVHFALFGFDPHTESQIRLKLVNGGGIDVGKNSGSCTHVIVDKIAYDNSVCIAARNDGKTLVTALWVEHSADIGLPVDANSVMYRPLKDLDGIPGAKDLIICLTGYLRQDREDIMTMVSLMGAQFSKPLVANKVTHLICYKFEGEKYELAKKLATIKLVNHRWLEDCLKNWVLLPEDKYNKSGFELEMMAEEAKDSEDEAEDSKLGQSGGRNRSRSPLGSKFGTAVTHGLSKSLREEASNAIPDSTGPQVFPNADNGKDSSTTTGNKNNSDQDVNLHNIGNLNNLGITVNTNSSGQRPNLRDDTSETKKLSYTGSTSASADVLAHSDGKLGAPSYSRKNQKGFKFSRGLDECDGNNLETPSTKVEKTSEGIKSACVEGSGKETGVIQEDYGNNLLPQKRTNEAASTKSKSRKITANAKLSIERTQPANGKSQGLKVSSVVDEPPVSDGFLSADKDGKNNLDTCLISKSAASATNSVAFDKPVSRNAESSQCNNARQNSAKKAVQSLSKSKISGETDITGFEMGQSDNEAEKFNITTNLECPSPGKKSKDEGFAGLDNWDLINEESNKLIKKSPRKKSAAKRTLGSRPRKGVTAKLKSPVSLNKTMQQDEGVSSSSRSKEIATSCTKKHQASPEILDVNKLMEQEKVCEYAEDVGGKTDFLDDETEAPDDKCEYELGVAPDEELVHLSKKLDTSAEEKLDAVDHDKKCEAMPPKKVSNKTEKQKLPSLLDSTSKLKVKHQATKRPASKTKKTTVAKKLAKSEEAAVSGEKIPNETKDEAEIKILKEVSVHSDISENSNVPRNKPDSFVEEEKENRPNDREHGLVDRTSVGNQTIKSSVKPANIIKSKKMKHNSSISEFKARAKTEATCFILSGHRFQRKEYQQVIKSLKGRVCRDSHQWSYQATHFIAPDPIRRTEKFFAASASGRWILKTDFLTASSQAGKLLPEEPYEWHKNGLTEDGAINMEAPRKWRLLKERTGHGAFYGMRIVVYGDCFAPPLDTLKRAVKAGDGTILATSPPYTRFLDSGVDYALVSPGMPHVDLWVQEFLKHEIPCVVPDYLVEYVCKPGLSLERHVLYGTHAWADRSFAKLQSKAEEIIEEVIPTKDYNDDDDDDVACQVCGSQERGDVMLICGDESGSVGCGVGTHIDCCNPPLTVVPEEDWFCPKCSGTQKCSQNPSKRKKGALSSSKK